MIKILEDLKALQAQAIEQLNSSTSAEQVEAWRVTYLGRKGALRLLVQQVASLEPQEKKEAGVLANAIQKELQSAYQEKANAFEHADVQEIPYDPTNSVGHLHPLTLTMQRIQDIFSSMGFTLVIGPEVEEQEYNFDLLNIPVEHPARSETDTFYIANKTDQKGKPLILRTHVSPMQIRGPKESNLQPPFSIFYYGRTFRSESTDATHESTFHQFEFMIVNETITLAGLKGIIETFYSSFFQKKVEIRLRPSYFPFTEPSVEVDMSCVFCNGEGCRVCKHSGWIEIAGAGMVHPTVLKNIGVDPTKFRGCALGGAVDRLAMLRHGVNDIRLFWSGDIRFLRQFT